MSRHPRNSHVSKILPLTTLRTIDLGGKKNSTPLFSRFCAKIESFFEEYSAPKSVHRNRGLRPLALSGWPSLSRTQPESGTFRALVVLFPIDLVALWGSRFPFYAKLSLRARSSTVRAADS